MLLNTRYLKDTMLILIMICLGSCFVINICQGQMQVQLTSTNYDTEFELRSDSYSAPQTILSYPTWSTQDRSKLELLPPLAWSNGRVLYSKPIHFVNRSNGAVFSLTTYLRFQIETDSIYGDNGDGFAFFITPIETPPNSPYGATMGLLSWDSPDWNYTISSRHLLALEFDTYMNWEVSDPSSSHIGIDINGFNSSVFYNSNSSKDSLYLYNNNTIDAWLEFNGNTNVITVWAKPITSQIDTESLPPPAVPNSDPILVYNISDVVSDLFQDKMFVGLTAASGQANVTVNVFSWSFTIFNNSTKASSSVSNSPSISAPIHSNHSSHNLTKPLLVALLVASFATILIFSVIFKLWQRSSQPQLATDTALVANIQRYNYKELKKATQGFRPQHKIGEGGFSEVYKGTLCNGSVNIAVKKLKNGVRRENDFASEVRVISRMRHKNLIELQGWCYEKNEVMLVYPFMARGSLDLYVFEKTKPEDVLRGPARLKILKGVAAALEYLHVGLGQRVLHRDVKAANVLLTDNWEAKLGDFGLARLIDPEHHSSTVFVTAAGTPGYVAPEVLYTGKASDKADVYSFGVLALELACGRRGRVVDSFLPEHEMRLIDWVWMLHQSGKLLDALDPRLNDPSGESLDDVAQLEWRCVLHVALLCCLPYPESRPNMSDVRQILQNGNIVDLPSTWPSYGRPACAFVISSQSVPFTDDVFTPPSEWDGR